MKRSDGALHQRILVTGGAGFIGSCLIRQFIAETEATVINVDALTYAGNLGSLAEARHHPRHLFEHVDIRDRAELDRIFLEHRPDAVMHLAAESHVDRSIEGSNDFIDSNIVGTHILLEAARDYWNEQDQAAAQRFRFHHVSTDEVYGDLGRNDAPFTEASVYAPHSPYAASKAASDHLARAWHHTYGLPVVLTHCSNNYGPFQLPEKLIPLMILNARQGMALPVYGAGENIRDWLYVEDHARALRRVLEAGEPGRSYNIGGHAEQTNLEVVRAICREVDASCSWHSPDSWPVSSHELITFVEDRPGHDRRYAIDDTRIKQELGWRPRESFETGLRKTVQWYLDNLEWVAQTRSDNHQQWMRRNYADRRSL